MAFKPEKDRKLRQILNRWKRFVMEGNEKEAEKKVSLDTKAVEGTTVGEDEDEKKGREKTEISKAKEANPNSSASEYVRQLPSTTRSLLR
jgi:hypothetical protein